jgi:cytochrome c oxidase assembly factor CtaG
MRPMRTVRLARGLPASLVPMGAATLWLVAATPALAHGPAPADPPEALNLTFGWTFEPLVTIGIVVALLVWRSAVRRVNVQHPGNPVPPERTWTFVGGMAAIAVALMSGIDAYDTTLFSIHMIQHILLILIAAPLIALSAPITLLLRVASPQTRHRWILPVLHSRVVRVVSHPVVASVIFSVVLWTTHFSPFFDAALEHPLLHDLEHALFLTSALLFWWPAVARDPIPYRLSHPTRILYVFMQMTMNTFMAMIILGAGDVLYPHYATVTRAWGPTALEDQKLAAGFMWIAGDLIFIGAILLIMAGWLRASERQAERTDRLAAQEVAAIRLREARLAERLSEERRERPT